MREIEFRGLTKDNSYYPKGTWVYGSLQAFKGYSIFDKIFKNFITVDSKSIGQWTGLYDKNKKRIYEGDKCKIDGGYNNRGAICNVVFNDGCFNVVGDLFRDYLKVYVANHSIEVIGNIYENEN